MSTLLVVVSLSAAEDFSAFDQPIPGTDHFIPMVPVRGGTFIMGSPESEPGRSEVEGPQHEVDVADFWMGQYEINWQQYELFVYRDAAQFNELVATEKLQALGIDGMTGATSPYVEMSFGMGKDGYPVVNVTQHAALHYAQWLSAKTGRFYRLPTEAEWEFACRAGTGTAFSFDEGGATLGDYAIYQDNSEGQYARPGTRKPNALQLYDMHGNVAEWTMDQFDPGYYAVANKDNPWNRPTELYPRVARGGSWIDNPDQLRCAARRPSAPNWKERDPQIPKSLWWLTNAPFVGFRLVSPRVQPSKADIERYWLEAIEDYGI
ncbi:MAG: SUMF1/EgtB/PvdO family nonheme iron enzyme [Halioglobus sp.]